MSHGRKEAGIWEGATLLPWTTLDIFVQDISRELFHSSSCILHFFVGISINNSHESSHRSVR